MYAIDITRDVGPVLPSHNKFGTAKDPGGNTLSANSLYFTKNGQPWFPVMGEMHFSRYPREFWEESLLKMKACGIEIVASYVFWIHHEEIEGQFDWRENKDLRKFIELCSQHGLYVWLRIGPWCHGECRNGGFPDWIVSKGYTRSNDADYLKAVEGLFLQVAEQADGLYFKNGGPIIGIQVENEYAFKDQACLAHMLTLKETACRAGMDVPFYSATGWPEFSTDQDDLMPVFGGYPAAPWAQHTRQLELNENFLFDPLRKDPEIGSDTLEYDATEPPDETALYPFATAELGGGNQVCYHRRPIIAAEDVVNMAYVKAGSGANLLGYYMFHGGSNPLGKRSTMQESRATGYANDVPVISYDFFAPIGEWGQLRESYAGFKKLHYFINDFGSELATQYAFFPDVRPTGPADNETLRLAVRAGNDSGFIFLNNYQRHLEMTDLSDVQVRLNTKAGVLQVPDKACTVNKDSAVIWPFNLDMDGALLKYSTAQPLCKLENNTTTYVFFAHEGMDPEYVFDRSTIKDIRMEREAGDVREVADTATVFNVRSGTSCLMTVRTRNGRFFDILTLTSGQAASLWKADIWGKQRLILSDDELVIGKSRIDVLSKAKETISLSCYPADSALNIQGGASVREKKDGCFEVYEIELKKKEIPVALQKVADASGLEHPLPLMAGAQPGPHYGMRYQPIASADCWKIILPEDVLDGVNDVFLEVNYRADTAAVFLDKTLVADEYYYGLPMTIGLKRFSSQLSGGEMLIQLVPLTEERDIYFEENVKSKLQAKGSAALLDITAVPQYRIRISEE